MYWLKLKLKVTPKEGRLGSDLPSTWISRAINPPPTQISSLPFVEGVYILFWDNPLFVYHKVQYNAEQPVPGKYRLTILNTWEGIKYRVSSQVLSL